MILRLKGGDCFPATGKEPSSCRCPRFYWSPRGQGVRYLDPLNATPGLFVEKFCFREFPEPSKASSPLLSRVISFRHLWYFSLWLQILKTKELSPEHNYLMGVHPHGLLAFGAFCNFCTEATGFLKIFPGITPHLATLSWFFKIPFIRDYLMAKGVSDHTY